jgi:hypothetical protein
MGQFLSPRLLHGVTAGLANWCDQGIFLGGDKNGFGEATDNILKLEYFKSGVGRSQGSGRYH